MEQEPRKYTVNFLDDDTTDDDAFGGHQRIADTLRDIICTTGKGKSIALLGDYGSGKSSVIKMMEKGLPEKIKVFTYDAWAHQGDHLRRSFLESLMNFLGNSEKNVWLDKTEEGIQEIANALTGRETHTVTEPNGKMSLLTALFLLMLIFYSWASTYLADTPLFEIPFTNFAIPPAYLWWVPVVFIILIYLGDKIAKKRRSWFSRIFDRGQTSTTTTTNSSPEPSSVEFEQYYRKILKHTLNEHPERKLVIVIDNLDRVDAHEAKAVWGTMQTFCHITCKEKDHRWSDQVWLIAPIEQKAAVQLWGASAEGLGIQFIEKTFQLVFKVPPPMVADWKKYFMDKLKHALPQLEQDLSDEIFTIYSMPYSAIPGTPQAPEFYAYSTPRSIINFLNKFSGLASTWQSEIPLNILALYLRGVDAATSSDVERAITYRNWPYLDKQPDSTNAYISLAMIQFGKKRDEASDILARKAIEEFLFSDNPLNVVDYSNSRVFTEYIVHHTLFQLRQKSFSRYRDIANIALVHEEAPLSNSARKVIFETFFDNIMKWNALYPSIDKENLMYIQDETSKGVIALLGFFFNNNSSMAKQLVTILGNTPDPIENDVALNTWLEEVINIVKWLSYEEGGEGILREKFSIGASAEVYLNCLGYMADNYIGEKHERHFRTTASEAEVLQELSKLFELKKVSQIISRPQISEHQAAMLKMLVSVYPDWNYENFISNVPFGLKSTEIEHHSSFVYLLDILLFMYTKSLKYWKQERLTKTAKYFNNFPSYIGFEKEDDDRSVLVIFLLICFPHFNDGDFNAYMYKYQQAFKRTAYDNWWPPVLEKMIEYFGDNTLAELIACQNRNKGISKNGVTTDEVIKHLIRLLSEKTDASKHAANISDDDKAWLLRFLPEQYDKFFGGPEAS